MTDPVTIAATAVKFAVPALGASRAALRKLRLYGSLDIKWFDLSDEAWLTSDEVNDLERFLSDRGTQALLRLLATTLLTAESDLRQESLVTLEDDFVKMAKKWRILNNSTWLNHIDAIWSQLRNIFNILTPAGRVLEQAALEFTDFISTPLGKVKSSTSSGERHVERIASLCSELERVTNAIDAALSLKSAIADAPTPPIITYTSTTQTASFDDLYVARTLRYDGSDTEVEHIRSGGEDAPYRAVLHGAPGAGKSTFVRNLRHELAIDDGGQPTLVVNVRTYYQNSQAQSQTLVDYLHASILSGLNLEVTRSAIQDGLTLGQYVVIFDGLDEITDINLRVETAARIASFAREYPVTSILVTSRAVGYDRAPLPATSFDTYVLDQYTDDQAREYVRRWFQFISRPDLIVEFERESQSVADLKSNPLVLSLLCVLYRERGSIPRRRRDIYAACADLLFHTWDSHRHIEQPEELHANGDRIMQEIARWVYGSQTAQNGLSERVIQKTIGIYLQDHVGVDEGEARRRAKEFLDFCANRAWLLGMIGTQYGERVFGFTHRTFFEYFTAEAFSRSTSDPKEVATILIDANKRDATSVLPELLLQAFDEKVDRGAGYAFEQVCSMTDDELLVLRLMEGVPLSSKVRKTGFDRVLTLWEENRFVSEASFVALLTLNPDARKQFIGDYLTGGNELAMRLFLGAWAALDLGHGALRHEPVWKETVDSCAGQIKPSSESWFSEGLQAWLWREGYAVTLPTTFHSVFSLSTASGRRIGALWLALEVLISDSEASRSEEIEEYINAALVDAKRPSHKVSNPIANSMMDALILRREAMPDFAPLQNLDANGPKWAYCYMMAILHEASRDNLDVREAFEDQLLPIGRMLWRSRDAASLQDGPETGDLPDGPPEGWTTVPRWLQDWASGKQSFIADLLITY